MIAHLDGTKETVDYIDNSRVRFYHNDEDTDYPLHWHFAIEIIMPLRCDYHLTVNNLEISLTPGDIIWVAPGILHSIDNPMNQGDRLIILVDPSILNEFREVQSVMPLLSPCYKISRKQHPEINQLLQDSLGRVIDNENRQSTFKDVITYAEILRFTSLLGNFIVKSHIRQRGARGERGARGGGGVHGERGQKNQRSENDGNVASDENAENGESAPGGENDQSSENDQSDQDWVEFEKNISLQRQVSIIYDMCEYIRVHSREDLNLEDLAAKSGFSKYYFSRLFKQITGMSFVDYLNACRISNVEKLLTDPANSLTDIAMETGFNNISTFNRVFKKHKNCTPSEFKNLMLSELS